ncbi:MAG: hypothetical protein U5Q16_17265 [Gammaproteobacteria bacterium]|nr:hypothetical protein [Gammaproteobacteria bacterium]
MEPLDAVHQQFAKKDAAARRLSVLSVPTKASEIISEKSGG